MAQITVEVSQISRSTASEGRVRSHRVLLDRPPDKGGADQGPMGGEVLLLGLGGCFMSNLIAALQARKLEVDGLRVRVRGKLEGTPPRFVSATLEVAGHAADEAELAKVITIAERGCIVANTLKNGLALEVRRASR